MLRVMCYVFRDKKAFTLIELLIAVAVVMLISAITFPKYNDFTERKRLESEAKQLVDVLELAKKKSMSSDLYKTCSNFGGYKVDVLSNSYTLNFICNSVSQTVQTYNFSAKNTIDLSKIGAVTFIPIDGTLQTEKNYILKNSALNKKYQRAILASLLDLNPDFAESYRCNKHLCLPDIHLYAFDSPLFANDDDAVKIKYIKQ